MSRQTRHSPTKSFFLYFIRSCNHQSFIGKSIDPQNCDHFDILTIILPYWLGMGEILLERNHSTQLPTCQVPSHSHSHTLNHRTGTDKHSTYTALPSRTHDTVHYMLHSMGASIYWDEPSKNNGKTAHGHYAPGPYN